MKVLGVIPARFASSRFPGKPLAQIAGRSMIERVYRRAAGALKLDGLIVATDDQRIVSCVEAFGGKVCLTSADCSTGTDRVAEVMRRESGFDVAVNIQGDEPLLEPDFLDQAVRLIEEIPEADITTLVRPARTQIELDNPNNVKAVLGQGGKVHYFSRCRIPYCKVPVSDQGLRRGESPYTIHIGLYVYRREVLLKLTALPPSRLELIESLEQLRALEADFLIYAACVKHSISVGVDTPEDVARVEQIISRLGLE
ncbi:MAG TPA: 3-deoxy-manno-octulosonate cytidylyltransferase [archaeon]|nr:3-deoxy-manno-octulosonate cytidylyltransferase [archaeon]